MRTYGDPCGVARALDLGASTGGFTDCLLQRGAAHVVAVDVAYGARHWRWRSDPRVTLIEPDVLKPHNVRVWYETVLAFLDHHVRGIPWRRPELLG